MIDICSLLKFVWFSVQFIKVLQGLPCFIVAREEGKWSEHLPPGGVGHMCSESSGFISSASPSGSYLCGTTRVTAEQWRLANQD